MYKARLAAAGMLTLAALAVPVAASASTVPANFPGDNGISCDAWHGAPVFAYWTARPARWQDFIQLLKPRVMSMVVFTALTGLPDIESCIVATSDLPRREAEVCSRILYGLSSVGIALGDDRADQEDLVEPVGEADPDRMHDRSARRHGQLGQSAGGAAAAAAGDAGAHHHDDDGAITIAQGAENSCNLPRTVPL